MIAKIIFGIVTGILLLGVCIWSYRISNVDNTKSGNADSQEEGDKA